MNILIADDSLVTLKFLQKILEGWGHSVLIAKDGIEALGQIRTKDSPRLCIIDWDMPGLTGVEICRKIRKEELDKYIIFLTAKDDILDISEGLESGADDYISKPFRQEELGIRLRAAIRILSLEEQLNIPHNKATLSSENI